MTPKTLEKPHGHTFHPSTFEQSDNAERATIALLIDAEKSAWLGSMSVSWWHEAVRQGRAPAPVIRGARCTRWRASDVLTFWEQLATEGGDPGAAERLMEQSQRASRAARAKRAEAGS